MDVEIADAVWLDRDQALSLFELADISGLSIMDVRQLMEYEALIAVSREAGDPTFSGDCVITARIAGRLRRDLELDAAGLALVLNLLGRIRDLQARVHALEAQSPGRMRQP